MHSFVHALVAGRAAMPPTACFAAAARPGAPRLRRCFATASRPADAPYPSLCVFDLDACLWDKEMFEMTAVPTETVTGELRGAGQGVTGAISGGSVIGLHRGALRALQEHHAGKYPGMRIAAASSADTPRAVSIGKAALGLLEVVPGTTVWELLLASFGDDRAVQIGRQPPLSADKSATHFPILREATGVPYSEMLFFDDCNWGDHCGQVAQHCREPGGGPGPVTQRTPRGLTERDWEAGMEQFAERAASR